MGNKRKNYSEAQNVYLVSQVSGLCPLCDEPLFYDKGRRTYKNYEIAHIYPLNPTGDEVELLKNEDRLSEDVNSEDNVIPLCEICHGKFDKPRTVEEYRQLFNLKKELIERAEQELLWKQYNIEGEISQIIEALYQNTEELDEFDINYAPKKLDQKLNDTMLRPTKRKIRNNVRDYFVFIRTKLSDFDKSNPDLSEMISGQIKIYYLKQKRSGHDQQAIFENIVSWIRRKTRAGSSDGAEILASFFIQNCEVFE